MLTIEEAKTKICPFMSNAIACDHPKYIDGALIEVKCRADKCMAWKFAEELETKESGITVSSGKLSTTNGYCSRL